jgi:hypothetical protein
MTLFEWHFEFRCRYWLVLLRAILILYEHLLVSHCLSHMRARLWRNLAILIYDPVVSLNHAHLDSCAAVSLHHRDNLV